MDELGKAFQAVFSKIGDFFNILDLSFFVSGVASTGGIALWFYANGGDIDLDIFGNFKTVGIILICYINGLISFAFGRWLRNGIGNFYYTRFRKNNNKTKEFEKHLLVVIKAHGVGNHPIIQQYLNKENYRGLSRLYVRLWAEIRHKPELSPSLSLLNRYWVMAATYDGLASSIFLWALTILDFTFGWSHIGIMPIGPGVVLFIVFLLLFGVLLREASRYSKYQIEDLIASLASTLSTELYIQQENTM